MAMTSTLLQVRNPIFNNPTPFVLTVSNSHATDTVTIQSLFAVVTTASGAPTAAFNLGSFAAPPGVSQFGGVGTGQYNIQVAALSSVKLGLPITFIGPVVTGAEANASSVYSVSVVASFSDGTTYTTPNLLVVPSRPTFGLAPGVPPNESFRIGVGQLNFTTPANSALAL